MSYTINVKQLHINNFLELEVSSGFRMISNKPNDCSDIFEKAGNIVNKRIFKCDENEEQELIKIENMRFLYLKKIQK